MPDTSIDQSLHVDVIFPTVYCPGPARARHASIAHEAYYPRAQFQVGLTAHTSKCITKVLCPGVAAKEKKNCRENTCNYACKLQLFSLCECHPCARAMLRVSFQFYPMRDCELQLIACPFLLSCLLHSSISLSLEDSHASYCFLSSTERKKLGTCSYCLHEVHACMYMLLLKSFYMKCISACICFY